MHIVETDGGPDHAIKTLQNKLTILSQLLITNVDKLIVTRGYQGLSYLKTVERKMSVLNTGLSNIALQTKPC